jgi:hypothetical protein
MDFRQLTAPCGLDCFNCVVYRANTDASLRQHVAKRLGVPVDKAVCPGCRAVQGAPAHLGAPGPCKVWRCISKKGLEFCFECIDFPCDALHPYVDRAAERPHNTKVFNLCLIKRMGLQRWAEDKAASVRETYYQGKLDL